MERIKLSHAFPMVFKEQTQVVSDVWRQELSFQKGECCLVEAASGTGKSSLCSYIYGWRDDYEGTICFDERDIRSLRTNEWVHLRNASLSFLFQDLRLFPELTAWDNVELKNKLTHYKTRRQLEYCFECLGIADKRRVPVGKISLGQQQRVAFIRALCQPFDFILLDEPVSHLDEANATAMAALLQEEAAAQGAGVLVTSIGKQLPMNYTKTLHL